MTMEYLKGNSGRARLYIIKYTTKFQDFCKKTNSLRFIVLMKSEKNCVNRKSILIGSRSDDVRLYFAFRS